MYILKKERMDTSRLIEPKDKVILDCGTGKGRNAIALVKEGAKLVVTMDISREMLEIAKGRAKKERLQDKIIFVVGDAENRSFPDNYFNASICIQTLMHLPNPQKCINELARVTKHDGIVIADHINANPLWRISIRSWKSFFRSSIIEKIYFLKIMSPFRNFFHHKFGFSLYPVVKRTTKRKFLNLFTQSALIIERVLEYGPNYCPIYFFICAKKK